MRDALAMAYALPERYQEMLSRGLELGENRIFAGMHSPLDVVGGRILAEVMVAADVSDTTFRALAKSGSPATDRFADYATNKANYSRRLTFGFGPIPPAPTAAVVPKSAEVLFETLLPYLSADQRRVVLKTTALASGFSVLDDAEGWGRLNLFAAADGYGSFAGNLVVSMDASLGGFSAIDTWRNDIAGASKLTFNGTGSLTLAGSNSYSGGTQIQGGTLVGGSANAFSVGDVYVSGGRVAVNATSRMTIGGKFTQLAAGTLEIDSGNGDQGRLAVSGQTSIVGGTLHVKLAAGSCRKWVTQLHSWT